jgi:hypothetical protein
VIDYRLSESSEGLHLKVGEVLHVSAALPSAADGNMFGETEPWTPNPGHGISGLISDHVVLCRFSPDEAPARTTDARFLAKAAGQTYIEASMVGLSPTPTPTMAHPATPCGSPPKTPACAGPGGGRAEGFYRTTIVVDP